jgi:hypothetical protein
LVSYQIVVQSIAATTRTGPNVKHETGDTRNPASVKVSDEDSRDEYYPVTDSTTSGTARSYDDRHTATVVLKPVLTLKACH